MDEKELNGNPHLPEDPADNIAGNETNMQPEDENISEGKGQPDNLADQLATLQDSYLRLMAEYDNYRKRTVKEKAELIKNGGEKVLVGLLPVVDDLERALQNIEKANNVEAVSEGVSLIFNKFMSFLNQNGVKPIETENMPFNDELYDAIATVPVPNKDMKGKVIDCTQKGYTLNDKVIRHAKVVVAE